MVFKSAKRSKDTFFSWFDNHKAGRDFEGLSKNDATFILSAARLAMHDKLPGWLADRSCSSVANHVGEHVCHLAELEETKLFADVFQSAAGTCTYVLACVCFFLCYVYLRWEFQQKKIVYLKRSYAKGKKWKERKEEK